ncbi:MAG TPA: hypothetical protein VH309_08215 [Elusimicrobiota bacterium]|jgi:hypothetical protein|nr:hypothetical protein [Elusimicrobiota bacterium]
MRRSALALLLTAACAGAASAQERPLDWVEAPQLLTVHYAADLSAGVSQNGSGAGTMRDSQTDASYQRRLPVTDRLTAILGGGYRRTDLFLSGGAPLPSTLQSANARVGGEWKFDDRWRAGGSISPGAYGDTDLVRSGDFKTPVSFFARYSPRPGLVWLGGLAFGFYGRRGVTPFIGAVWQIDERWRLNATPPMARLTYLAARTKDGPVELFLGAGYNGGRYQVAPDFGSRFNRPELNGNTLSVQQGDVRVGTSARWRFLLGELGVGYQFARRFVYEQAAETFDAGAAPYLSASLVARF